MGIFMITISQISSHTVVQSSAGSAGHPRLELGANELPAVRVVLANVEACTGFGGIDPACARNPDGQACENLVHLDVAVLDDADPAGRGHGLRERVADGTTLPVAATDVEARIEQAPVAALAEHHAAPRQMPFAGRVDAAVARVVPRAVAPRERQALPVDANSLDDDGVA